MPTNDNELLTKLVLDPTDWKKTIEEIKAQLSDVSSKSDAAARQSQASTARETALLKEQSAVRAQTHAQHAKNAATSVAHTEAVAKAHQATAAQQLAEIQRITAAQARAHAEQMNRLEQEIREYQRMTAAIQANAAALREQVAVAGGGGRVTGVRGMASRMLNAPLGTINLQGGEAERAAEESKILESGTVVGQRRERRAQSRDERETFNREESVSREARASEEGGGVGERFGKLRESILSGALGTGLFANTLQGVAAGAAGGAIFAGLTEGLEKLLEKMREFITDSGRLQRLLDNFQRLSRGEGYSPAPFLDDLFTATHRLVSETDVLRLANTYMQSGLKISKQDVVDLTRATIDLTRAQGENADKGLAALRQTFLTGRAWSLASEVGIPRQMMQIRGAPPEMSNKEKQQWEFDYAKKMIIDRARQQQAPPITYSERLTQMRVSLQDLYENLAQGAVKSAGFGLLMQQIGHFVSMSGGVESAAEKVGNAIGTMLGVIGTLAGVVKDLGSDIGGVVSDLFNLGKEGDDSATKLTPLEKTVEAISGTILSGDAVLKEYISSLRLLIDLTHVLSGHAASPFGEHFQPGMYVQALDKLTSAYKNMQIGKTEYEQKTKEIYQSAQASGGAALVDKVRKYYAQDQAGVGTRGKSKGPMTVEEAFKEYDARDKKTAAEWSNNIDKNNRIIAVNKIQQAISNSQSINKLVTDLIAKYKGPAHIPQKGWEGVNTQIKKQAESMASGLGVQLSDKDISGLEMAVKSSALGPIEAHFPSPALTRRNELAMATSLQQAKIALAQAELAKTKEIIAKEQNAWDIAYQAGKKSVEEYYTEKQKLAARSYAATVKEIGEETKARQELLKKEAELGEKFTPAQRMQQHTQEVQARTKSANAETQRDRQVAQAKIAIQQDEQQQRIQMAHAFLDEYKSIIQQEIAVNQKMYSMGDLSAREYLNNRLSYIEKEKNATVQAYTEIARNQKPEEKRQTYVQLIQLLSQYQQQLATLGVHPEMSMMQDVTKMYGGVQQGLQGNLSLLNGPGGMFMMPGVSQSQIYAQMRDNTQQQINQMQQLLGLATPYSESWFQIYNNILKSTQQLQDFADKAQQASSHFANLGSMFSTGASVMQNIATGSFAQGFEASIGQAGAFLQTIPQLKEAFAGGPKKGPQTNPQLQELITNTRAATDGIVGSIKQSTLGMTTFTSKVNDASQALGQMVQQIFAMLSRMGGNVPGVAGYGATGGVLDLNSLTNPMSGAASLAQTLFGGLSSDQTSIGKGSEKTSFFKNMFSSFENFSKSVSVFVNGVGQFVSSISAASSPSGGAIAGAMGGAGLGNSIGSSISALGSMGGPLGAVVGGAAGMMLGMMTGQKEQQLHQNIVDLQFAYIKMTEAMATQNASLNQTIQTLEGLIATAEQEQASSKKGGSQYQDLINQYNQELSSLKAQAIQTMQTLQEQLNIASSPNAYQDWISQIQQVIEQYKEFASAASNTQQLAQANNYLTDSLKNIGYQMGTQLLSSEEQAIQNALQLNQLYLQRNDLEYQYLQTTMSIMGQGTLTRQQTVAQTKYSQLFHAQADYQQQLDQINLQINLTQEQVKAAQQVFQLATTKAGLESQLLTLQNQSIAMDMQRISAMQNLLQMLGSTGYSIANLAGLSGLSPAQLLATLLGDLMNLMSGSGSNSADLNQLLGLLGSNGGTGSFRTAYTGKSFQFNPNSLDASTSAAYSQRASWGYGQYRANNM